MTPAGLLQGLTVFLYGCRTDSFQAARVDVQVGEDLKDRGILGLESLLISVVQTAQLVGTEEEGPGHSDGGEDFKLLHLISNHLGLLLAVFTWELTSEEAVSSGYSRLSR